MKPDNLQVCLEQSWKLFGFGFGLFDALLQAFFTALTPAVKFFFSLNFFVSGHKWVVPPRGKVGQIKRVPYQDRFSLSRTILAVSNGPASQVRQGGTDLRGASLPIDLAARSWPPP
jgi:hypothetical protein